MSQSVAVVVDHAVAVAVVLVVVVAVVVLAVVVVAAVAAAVVFVGWDSITPSICSPMFVPSSDEW